MFHKSNSKWIIEILSFFFPNSENIHVHFPHTGNFPYYLFAFYPRFVQIVPIYTAKSLPPTTDLHKTFGLCYIYL